MSESDRGFDFAASLHDLCLQCGPADFSPTSRAQLADYLMDCTVEWVRAHNRLRNDLKPGRADA